MEGSPREIVAAGIRKGLEEGSKELVLLVKERIRANGSFKSSRLWGSIDWDWVDEFATKVGSLYDADSGAPLVYAAQVEFGGPIPKDPSKGPLAIPLPWAPFFTPSGVGGVNARDLASFGGNRAGEYRFRATFRGGGPRTQHLRSDIIYGSTGDGKLMGLFILKDKVVQKGKPYLTNTVNENIGRVVSAIEEEIVRGNALFGRG